LGAALPLAALWHLGANSPVCLLRLRYLSRVGIETPKVLTTSLLGMPRSTASSTFSLRSSE
jgi:hypothetical protein